MKITVDIHMFRDEFRKFDRYGTFSYEGYQVLFDYFEELEDSCGEEWELDVISICCDWAEDSLDNILEEYNLESLEDLEENTTVLHVKGDMYIYQAF